jgi:pSer/pThr/pTyr-binding forkhead associated (FHA) protein
MARLVWEREQVRPVAFELVRDVMVIGRDEDVDIRLEEPLVSRFHARIERRAGVHFVVDLGSTNYTRVNGQTVREQQLKDGDEVRFARARCRYEAEEAPASEGLPPET